jgi:predicted nucleic-acid-binding Zn-ribbon protein
VKCPKCGKSNPIHSKAISIDLTNSPMKKEFEVVKNMINAKNAIKAKKI